MIDEGYCTTHDKCREQAEELETLRAENAALKTSLAEAEKMRKDAEQRLEDAHDSLYDQRHINEEACRRTKQAESRLAEAEKDRDAARILVDEWADKWAKSEMEKAATYEYRVSVQQMIESHRTTYWVCLDRPDRPKDAKPWDKGRITPFMTGIREHAEIEAKRWSEFLSLPSRASAVGQVIEAAREQERLSRVGEYRDVGGDRLFMVGHGYTKATSATEEAIRKFDGDGGE